MKKKLIIAIIAIAVVAVAAGSVVIVATSKHQHDYVATVTEPTCTEQGYTTYTCECGDSYVGDYVSPKGHAFVDDVCIVCGSVVEKQAILEFTLSDDGKFYILSGLVSDDCTTAVIPATYNGLPVEKIASYVFYNCTKLTSLTIPNSITSIGASAFYGCKRLSGVTIPDNVTYIGSDAFGGCVKLNEINYNATNCADLSSDNKVFYNAGQSGDGIRVTIGKNVKKIPAYLFALSNISSVVFEEGSVCESIGSSAFRDCSSLTSVTIGNNVTSIGYCAFDGCTSLTNVTIGNNVTSIGNSAFNNCTALTEINYNATNCADLSSSNRVFSNAGQSGDGIKVTIGKNVRNIPTYLFYPYYDSSYSPKITSVVFEKNII